MSLHQREYGFAPSVVTHVAVCAELAAKGCANVRQVDRSFASKGLLPSWYMALRLPLTLAAVTGMSLTLVSSVMDSEAAVGPEAARAAPSADGASFPGESPGSAGGPQEMQLAGVREKE